MSINKDRDCNQCGHRAVYRQPDGSLICEACANSDHGFEEGRQFMAAEQLMLAAQVARARGLTVSDLHTLITTALEGGGDEIPNADVPILSVDAMNRPSERRWLTELVQIRKVA